MSENFQDIRRRRIAEANREGLGRGLPNPLQPGVKAPIVVVSLRGYSVSTSNHQDVYVDGNDSDHEKPTPTGLMKSDSYLNLYDEGRNEWNRMRGNYNELLYPAASYAATQQTPIFDNFNAKGGHFILNVTAIAAGVGLIPSIYGYDPQTNLSYPILNDAAGGAPFTVAATGLYIQKVYPGITPLANLAAADVLPRFFYYRLTQTGVGAATYSVSFNQVI